MPYIRIFLARWYELLQLIYKQKSPAGSIISLVSNHIWLVVDLPLWKIVYSQLGWFFPIYGKKHVPNHQPVIIRCWNHWKTHLNGWSQRAKGWSQRKLVVSYCWGNGWCSLIFRHIFWQHQEKFMVLLSED